MVATNLHWFRCVRDQSIPQFRPGGDPRSPGKVCLITIKKVVTAGADKPCTSRSVRPPAQALERGITFPRVDTTLPALPLLPPRRRGPIRVVAAPSALRPSFPVIMHMLPSPLELSPSQF
ncbi:hypothetical protein Kisp02_36950 [Kineosporia sp. NBRC 101731]|nr:hypothetical protein Kisp02_36950 [Kineosporia sp. NBRC 101731]